MKKIALLIVFSIAASTMVFSQTGETVASLLKASKKSDADIANAKKSAKYSTWEKRGNLFLKIAQYNTKGLYSGMPSGGLVGAETLVGKPNRKIGTKVGEDWFYDRMTLHFKNGKLFDWDETKPVDKDALNKAYEAYLKAAELDSKGKFKKKNTTKTNVSVLRNLLTDKGIGCYKKEDYKEATSYLKKGLELNKFPKFKNDTAYQTSTYTYYVGLSAQSAGDIETAKKYYHLCIDKGYMEGNPYKSLAEIYKSEKKPEKEIETLQAGFKKYPDSQEIMYAFINYYLQSGQSDKALKIIGKAIKTDPSNHSLYHVTGALYGEMAQDTTNKYNAKEKETYFNEAVTSYKKAISLKDDYFEPCYNLGALYYNKAANILREASKLDLKQAKEYEAALSAANEQFKLALPYMEKAHKLNPKEKSTIQTLVTIYHKLKKYPKEKEMKAKLDQL